MYYYKYKGGDHPLNLDGLTKGCQWHSCSLMSDLCSRWSLF